MRKILMPFLALVCLYSCKSNQTKPIEGKIEQEQLSVVSKIAGKISKINVAEGDVVAAGDTLLILDLPEVAAKKEQALGALESADAQYSMAKKGATNNQLIQLRAKVSGLKEQLDFAEKSTKRLKNLLIDSLVPQQKYDEVYAKYQGAKNQYIAAKAELDDASNGARIEQQQMAKGQQVRAKGAVAEVGVAEAERYVLAPKKMTIQSISLKEGELALPGYSLVSGFLNESTYFRFTIAEKQLAEVKNGQTVNVFVPYNKQFITCKVVSIKPLSAYANISSAYPDFEQGQTLYEIKAVPQNMADCKDLIVKSTVQLDLQKK